MIGPDHYRYVDDIGPEGVTIRCEKWIVCGETPQCWYVIPEHASYLLGPAIYADSLKKTRKRVLKYEGGKKLCYPNKDDALRSYRIRKRWQLRHTEHAVQRATTALAELERLTGLPEDKHLCQGGEYFKELNWLDF